VHVARREKFSSARSNPLFPSGGLTLRAVAISTAVIRNGGTIPTTGALIDMAAQCGRATPRNGQQHFDVAPTNPRAVLFDELSSRVTDEIGHLEQSSRVAIGPRVTKSPTDSRPHADDVQRDAGTSPSLSGRYGLTGAGWCGDRCRLRVDVWRSSAAEYEDARVSEGRPAGRLGSRHARRFSYRSADPRNG